MGLTGLQLIYRSHPTARENRQVKNESKVWIEAESKVRSASSKNHRQLPNGGVGLNKGGILSISGDKNQRSQAFHFRLSFVVRKDGVTSLLSYQPLHQVWLGPPGHVNRIPIVENNLTAFAP